jgi:LPXTG-motif cell wall-anchored protein
LTGFGGGILVGENGDLIFDIIGTTVSGNAADGGGGLFAGLDPGSVLTISNSTFSGNSASVGGGVMVGSGDNGFGRFLLRNSTVVANVSETALGGLAIGPLLARVENTISSGNTADGIDSDLTVFAPVPGDFNLFEAADPADTTGSGNIFGQAAQLGTLQNNGGTIPTRLPQAGSPAIDTGDPDYSGPLTTDQRGSGFDRVSGGRLDIGAVEVQVDDPDPDPDPTPDPDPGQDPDDTELAATGTDATVPLLAALAALALGAALVTRSRKASS